MSNHTELLARLRLHPPGSHVTCRRPVSLIDELDTNHLSNRTELLARLRRNLTDSAYKDIVDPDVALTPAARLALICQRYRSSTVDLSPVIEPDDLSDFKMNLYCEIRTSKFEATISLPNFPMQNLSLCFSSSTSSFRERVRKLVREHRLSAAFGTDALSAAFMLPKGTQLSLLCQQERECVDGNTTPGFLSRLVYSGLMAHLHVTNDKPDSMRLSFGAGYAIDLDNLKQVSLGHWVTTFKRK